MPNPKSTKRPPARKGKGKDPRTQTRARPPLVAVSPHFAACAPPRAILPTSPEVQKRFLRRLAVLADDAAAVSDVLEGQSGARGENDSAMVRIVARVLKALTFFAVSINPSHRDALLKLDALARASLRREGVVGVRLAENGTPLDPGAWDGTAFVSGGDLEFQRAELLSHLHASFMLWLEKGHSHEELAQKTCTRVLGLPSPLREVAKTNGVDLASTATVAAVAREFRRVQRRRGKPDEWWRLAQRMLTRAAIVWGVPETEAKKLFDFQRKSEKRGTRSPKL